MCPAKRRFSIVVCLYTPPKYSVWKYFYPPPFFNSVGTNTYLEGGRDLCPLLPATSHASVCVCVFFFNVSTSSCLQHSAVRSYSACACIHWHRLRRCRVLWDCLSFTSEKTWITSTRLWEPQISQRLTCTMKQSKRRHFKKKLYTRMPISSSVTCQQGLNIHTRNCSFFHTIQLFPMTAILKKLFVPTLCLFNGSKLFCTRYHLNLYVM